MPQTINTQTKDAVYILDSYGLIYRAYFALFSHPLTNSQGQNISALVIFFRNLRALLAKYKPGYLVAAFDSRTPTFRHEMYPEYKATRDKTPQDLHDQVPWIEEVLTCLNVPVLQKDGYEADDIIATVASKCEAEGRPCNILSGDKDLLQLVSKTCAAMQPDKANGGWLTEGIDEVIEKWGIGPEKILDYLSLVGDSADNVPGVKGVGEKTALKLLKEYGCLDGIYENASSIKGAIGSKIRDGKDSAYFSKKLIKLCSDVPIAIDFDSFSTENLDFEAAAACLVKYGANAAAKSYSQSSQGEVKSQEIEKKEEVKVVKKNSGNYRPCTEEGDLVSFIDSILNSKEKEVAFDTETDGLNTRESSLVGFSLSVKSGSGIYVPVILPGEMFAEKTIAKDLAVRELNRLLSSSDITLITHNGKFDLEVLASNGCIKKPLCNIVDTMVAAWLLNPDALGKSPYSLEFLGESILGLKGTEFSDIVPKGKTFADIPLEKAYPYGAEDADFTWQLWQVFKKKISENGLDSLYYDMEMKLLPILCQMEEEGIHLDKKALASYSEELADQINVLEEKIYKEAGHEFNIASPKQLQEILFTERGLVPGKKTRTGYSTDTEVLTELSLRTSDPLPSYILDYRARTKILNTYAETLPQLADKNSRVHTSFMQTGTATGRLSSRDPNLQNIPVKSEDGRKIRSAFTAEKGTILISADYSQIELVVLAHLSGDERLSKAFIDGVDVHKSTAALIYGVDSSSVTAEMRRFAKTVNFGVMYGMGAFSLAKDLGISRTEAKKFIDQYFDTYSQVKEFIDSTIKSAHEKGYSQTIMGRRRYIEKINSSNKIEMQGAERIAINTPIQGSAADIVKKAMIDLYAELEKIKSPVKMLLQVHDELIFSCPDDQALVEETKALIREKMEGAVKLNVPLRVSIESGENWGLFH